MSKRSKWVGVLIASAAIGGTWALFSGDDHVDAGSVSEQVWLERLPDDDRDMISHMVFLDFDGERYGVVGSSSVWRHEIDVVRWKLDGARLDVEYPQTKRKLSLETRVWSCEGEAPAPFTLCLEIKDGDSTRTYYSHEDWVVESSDIDQVRQLPAAVSQRIAEATER